MADANFNDSQVLSKAAVCLRWLNLAHECIEQQTGWLVTFSALLFGAALLLHDVFAPSIWPMGTAAGAVLMCTILLFTRPLKVESDINSVFRFAWGFLATILLVCAAAIYFSTKSPQELDAEEIMNQARQLANDVKPTTPTNEPQTAEKRAETSKPVLATDAASAQKALDDATQFDPLGNRQPEFMYKLVTIVHGCDYHAEQSKFRRTGSDPEGSLPRNPGMPDGIYCGELPPQWVISIGGSVMRCHFDGRCPQSKRPLEDIATLKNRLQQFIDKRRAAFAVLEGSSGQIEAARGLTALGIANDGPSVASLNSSRDAANKSVSEANAEIAKLQPMIDGWDNQSWNIEGTPIVGGVVVPVYFAVLALIGALISMMRKLPEFQERVDPDYEESYRRRLADGDAPMPPISKGYARDLVVFQILQVMSAPAIAIVAYSWARPEELSTTVLLAFAAGFSSEVFLIAIRAAVDRIIGLGPRPMRARARTEDVATQNDPNKLPAPGAITPPAPGEVGGFKVGDRVTLVMPIDIFLAGSEGIVLAVTPNRAIGVRLTQDHTGMPIDHVLETKGIEFFKHSADVAATSEPVG